MPQQHKTTRQIIRSFEAKAMKRRSLSLRIADVATSYFGSLQFFVSNIIIFVSWLFINTGNVPWIEPFDPFPFNFLTMAVSLEAIFLSVIVLISQNRQGYISSVRDELILQTNLIAEREVTKALQLIAALHKHHGVKRAADPELEAMLKDTDIPYIERKLEEQLQGPQPKPSPLSNVVTKPIEMLTESISQSLQNGQNGNGNGNHEKETVRVGVGVGKVK